MTDAHYRDRINFLRLLLIIGLVFLHYGAFPGAAESPYEGFAGFDSAHPVSSFINVFLIFVFYSSVPVLGVISGYLFFKNWEPGLGFYTTRITSRTFSIFLPMLSWCAIILGVFFALYLITPDSQFLGLTSYDFDDFGIRTFINALAGVTRRPINFQFWFLRDLFLTVLCTPFLGLALRRAPYAGLAIIGGIWLFNFDVPVFFRNDVFFFFYLGALVRVRGWELDFISPKNAAYAMLIYLVLAAFRTAAPEIVAENTIIGELIYGPGTRMMRILGVVAFWGCAPYMMRTFVGRQLVAWGSLAFFLHAIHWPLNQFLKTGLAAVIPAEGEVGRLLNLLGTTSLTLAISFAVAWILHTTFPALFSHLSGGRAFGRARVVHQEPVVSGAKTTATIS